MKLEKRSIILYHSCIRKTLDYWYREYGLVNCCIIVISVIYYLYILLFLIKNNDDISNNCREVKQVDKKELASYARPYDLSTFDHKFMTILRNTSDDLLKRWLPKICNILLMVRNSF